jgi:hypothetical protein
LTYCTLLLAIATTAATANIRSIKCKRKCQKIIMSAEEASGVCKDRLKWRVGGRKKGGDMIMLLAYPVREYGIMILCMYIVTII